MRLDDLRRRARRDHLVDDVVRHFDVHRPLVLQARFDAAHDLACRGLLIQQDRRRDGDLVVDALLRLEGLHLVVQ
jgi:hypothetical protein